ncbi:hypothetical protein HMN09_00350000 [Mycena chlorophos]|uniref:F-box domain-containing protein n=1 Tax=Mycena chlorophos TaxID=658473 RepID=A0A8H6WKT6_MYCCL|nr:hypothetical protein HMN09_00350000 [Mycena chlorophos]
MTPASGTGKVAGKKSTGTVTAEKQSAGAFSLPLLPAEVWWLIFEHHSDDAWTLASIARVSRSFRATSTPILIRHVVWKSPDHANQNLSWFWDLFPEMGRHVRSLVVDFDPPRLDEDVVFDLHEDLFDEIHIFASGLTRLSVIGTSLPPTFFAALEGLPNLRQLTVRQCPVPKPPERLTTPGLDTLSLSCLVPYTWDAYSPYFAHLFPTIDTVLMDGATLPQPGVCAPRRLRLAPCVYRGSPKNILDVLHHFGLSALEELVIAHGESWGIRAPPPVGGALPNLTTRLRSIVVPVNTMAALLSDPANELLSVETVGLCGPIRRMDLEHSGRNALVVIQSLVDRTPRLRCFSITMGDWYEDLILQIAEHLPRLEALEILYDLPSRPPKDFLQRLHSSHLPKLPLLKKLHLHLHPSLTGLYPDAFFGPASLHTPERFSVIDTLTRAAPSLERVRLGADAHLSETWVRPDAATPWVAVKEAAEEIEWSSGFVVLDELKPAYSLSVYR